MINNSKEEIYQPYVFVPPTSTNELTTAPANGGPMVMFKQVDPITAEQLDSLLGNYPLYQEALQIHGPLFKQYFLSHVAVSGAPSRITCYHLTYYRHHALGGPEAFNYHWRECSRFLNHQYHQGATTDSGIPLNSDAVGCDYVATPPQAEDSMELGFFSYFDFSAFSLLFSFILGFYFLFRIYREIIKLRTINDTLRKHF